MTPRTPVWQVLCILLGTFFSFSVSGQAPSGRVIAWGDDSLGQADAPPDTNVIALSAKGDFSMGLRANGQVIVWGAFAPPVPPTAANSTAIAAGGFHCLALRADRKVVAWGENDAGQANVPTALTNVTAIAGGMYHSLAVSNGFVFGWGANNFGELPLPGTINNIRAVAAGLDHSVALRSNGTVLAWGRNNLTQSSVPPGLTGIKSIAVGANHSLALHSNGTVIAWGANNAGQLNLAPTLTGVRAIGAGGDHSIAVRSNGTVIVWGSNSSFQTNVPPGTTNIIAVAGGQSHCLALQLDPLVIVTQPQNQNVMQGATVTFNVAVIGSLPVSYQWQKNGTPINNATNSSYSIFNASTNDIAFYSVVVGNPLGSLTSSNAALQVNVPIFLTEQPQSQDVGIGGTATFRVTAGGTPPIRYYWRKSGTNIPGANGSTYTILNVQSNHAGNYSVLVSNDFASVLSTTAVLTVHSGPVITQQPQNQNVVAGSSVTFTVIAQNADDYEWRKDGTPIANATNSFYAIASAQPSHVGAYSVRVRNQYGTVISSNALLNVTAPPPSGSTRIVGWPDDFVWNGTTWVDVRPPNNAGSVIAVAVGGAHSLALRSDGTVIGWGDNTYGQAGAPPAASNVIAIAAGFQHSLALRNDGQIVAWGRNDNWQQTTVPPHSGVIAIAAGADHSLAVQSNGVVIGWGRNTDGRATPPPTLGLCRAVGAGSDHSLVVRSNSTVTGWGGQNLFGETRPPSTLSNVMALAGGAHHSMALRSNGTVVVWGDNTFGQTNVPSFAGAVRAIASGANHCLALLQNGTVVAWGNGNNGQTNVPPLINVMAIAAGADRNLVVKPRQLVLQPPERQPNGRYRLTLTNEDGSAITIGQQSRVQIFASSNLVAASNWVQLTEPMSIVNGSIRIEDTQTNLPRRFYRARENP
jgi:alpha-tubulin suppressor-like RCC1 family protein